MKPTKVLLLAASLVALALVPIQSAAPSLEGLVGNWIRPDVGYRLVVSSIGEEGKVQAAYFNPNPIHVAEASATDADGKVTLFVKLEAEGYPGSTYNLTLSEDGTKLVGEYFQAAAKQTFEIFFERAQE